MIEKTIKFTVTGDAIPKARPKLTINRYTKRAHLFTPETTRDWEATVLCQAIKFKPVRLISGNISITVNFYKGIPKSISKKNRILVMNNEIRPAKKPDIDNLLKSIFDALTGIFWVDDSQIVDVVSSKFYSDSPRVEIEVKYKENENA